MKEIALIATYDELVQSAVEAAKDLDIEVEIKQGLLDEAIHVAQKLIQEGCQVLVSRGETFRRLKKVNLGVPMVEIKFTGYDIFRALQEASLQSHRIALMVSRAMVYDISNIKSILKLDVKEYFLESEREIERKVKQAIEDGAEAIIGVVSVLEYVKTLGVSTYLVKSGKEAICLALSEAREIVQVRKQEQERAKRLQAILDFAYEGIIAYEGSGKVTIFNSAAEKLLGMSSQQALNPEGEKIIPEFGLLKGFPINRREIGALIKREGKQFVANKIPIDRDGLVVGGVITFQEVRQLQNIEHDIRKKLISKGHSAKYTFADILGEAPEFLRSIHVAQEFAKVDASVLILGETGVGKEMFAHSIHNASSRRGGPFVAINCAVIPQNLLESELFGYAEGAFTGARKNGRAGLFELAHGGTIFLDELGEMAPETQARLLRVLEEKEVMRLGDEKVIPIDARVVAATNKNLKEMVEKGAFRSDLFYRLNVLQLLIPPLREREEDIPILVRHFLASYNQRFDKDIEHISDGAIERLVNYDWPGNIRQLENFMGRLVVLKNDSILTEDDVDRAFFEMNLRGEGQNNRSIISLPGPNTNTKSNTNTNTNTYKNTNTNLKNTPKDLSLIEEETIKRVLLETGNNYTKTSRELGISRTTLWRKLKKLGIVD